ncbi:MAG: DUF2905 family protein [Anaerolineales bacterium]
MPDLTNFARWIVIAGLAIAALGGLLWLLGRSGLPLGRLPGDFRFESNGFTCFIPLATSLLLSLVLTLLLNLIARWLK